MCTKEVRQTVISGSRFVQEASARDINFYVGVPCSFLTPLLNSVISNGASKYVGATSEGEAVAVAAGAWLAGKKTVVMCQNSGLGNAINPLTSLNATFQIPLLLITTWRGRPGEPDAPQHSLMGEITRDLLETIRVPHLLFPSDCENLGLVLDEAIDSMRSSRLPFALVLSKDQIVDETLSEISPQVVDRVAWQRFRSGGKQPTRAQALECLTAFLDDDIALIASTGKCGRELFTISDRPQNFYLVGSMGCASAVALGVALNYHHRVVVLDGDGSALMKLGNLATIGAQSPSNLVHVVLDNGVHDSTGGQLTASSNVDFAGVAANCGYRNVMQCDTLDSFGRAVEMALRVAGPVMIHMNILPGSLEELQRPTIDPPSLALRFREFLSEKNASE